METKWAEGNQHSKIDNFRTKYVTSVITRGLRTNWIHKIMRKSHKWAELVLRNWDFCLRCCVPGNSSSTSCNGTLYLLKRSNIDRKWYKNASMSFVKDSWHEERPFAWNWSLWLQFSTTIVTLQWFLGQQLKQSNSHASWKQGFH